MDPTRRSNEIPATFQEFDAAMAMDASHLMQGGVAGGDGGAAGIGTSSPAPPQPYVTEETRLPRNDFVSRAPYSSPAPRLLHRRASSDIMGLASGDGGEGDLFSRFAAGVEEVNNSAFVNPSRHMARAAGRPRPRHHHSQSMDASSSSLQAQRALFGLSPATANSSRSLQPQRQLGLPLLATSTIAQASSVLRAQDWLLGLPATTTTQASHGLGLPASRQPQMLQLGGWPATGGSLYGQAQRLPHEFPATASPSSSGQPQRLQLGGSPATATATAQALAGSLQSQARLLDLRAAATPSSSGQPWRLQLGGLPATATTTTPSSSGPAERLKLGSPAKGKAKATVPAGPSKLAIRKAMLAVEFEQIAINDPVRARRMLANRQSAARSKERKARYLAELEQKTQAMENDVAALLTNVALWQRNRDMLTAEKNELMARIENSEQHSQSQDALTESLKLEIQYLQNFSGLPQPHGGDQLMHHQIDWMQQLQMPPPHQLPQSSHQAPLHHQGAQQQQQQAQPNLRMKEPMDASTCGQMDDGDSTGSEGNGN